MHDVRPVDSQGNLDLEKIRKVDYVSKRTFSQIAKTSSVRFAPTFYDVRQLTPQEMEVKRFQKAILEEKEKASRAKMIAQNAEDTYTVEMRIKEQSLLKEKLAEEARRLAREREANLIFQQEKKEQEAQRRRKLLLRKVAAEKQKEEKKLFKRKRKEEKDALKRKRKYEAKLARELFINKFWHFLNSPFREFTRLKKSFSDSIKDFFEIFIPRGRAYAGYQTKPVGKKKHLLFLCYGSLCLLLSFWRGIFLSQLASEKFSVGKRQDCLC